MSDATDDEYAELGRSVAGLRTLVVLETAVNDIPPIGAGKLLHSCETTFLWEPIPESAWRDMSDVERGRIAAQRATGWLERNAALMTAPFSFVDASDEQVNQMFGVDAQNVHEAICATYRMLERREEAVEYSLIGLAAIATVSVGAHAVVLGLAATAAIVKSYGVRYCSEPDPTERRN
jgi:hypothetical protein